MPGERRLWSGIIDMFRRETPEQVQFSLQSPFPAGHSAGFQFNLLGALELWTVAALCNEGSDPVGFSFINRCVLDTCAPEVPHLTTKDLKHIINLQGTDHPVKEAGFDSVPVGEGAACPLCPRTP